MTQKVGIFINSRSEYACLLSVLRAAIPRQDIEVVLILGGEFADADIGLKNAFVRPGGVTWEPAFEPWRLHTLVHNRLSSHATMARSAAMMALDTTTVISRENFTKAILVGDRYDTLGAAMTLAYMGVPIFHIQGGEESGNIDESIRHSITKLAHVHLVANQRAADNVRKLGENPEYVIVTGCPSLDLFNMAVNQNPMRSGAFLRLADLNTMGVGQDLDPLIPYIVVIYHPETFSKPTELGMFIEALASLPDHQKIILHPNAEPWSDHILKALKTAVLENQIGAARLISYIEPDIFASVLSHASCLVGNSSAGIRQAGFIRLPVINIGKRQHGRSHGENVVTLGSMSELREAASMMLDFGHERNRLGLTLRNLDPGYLYGDGHSAERILQAVLTMNPPIQKRLHY